MSKFCYQCGNPMDDPALFCNKCGARVQTVCKACGTSVTPGNAFCQKCGTPVNAPQQATKETATVQPIQPIQPVQPQSQIGQVPPVQPQSQQFGQVPPVQPLRQAPPIQPQTPAYGPQGGYTPAVQNQPQYTPPVAPGFNPMMQPAPVKKSKTGLIIGISAGAVVILVLLIVGIPALSKAINGKNVPNGDQTQKPSQIELIPFPAQLIVDTGNVNVNCEYTSPEYIIPANYRSLDSVVFLQCSADKGKTDVMVEVEIPGFTQKFQQKIEVSRSETELKIHPPLVDGAAKTLNSSKDAQIMISVTDLNSGKVIIQDTKPIKLYSRFDMQWQNEDGTPNYENILAWVTPEAPEIKTLLRLAADSCNKLSNGQLDAIVGYQMAVSGWNESDITYVQSYAMMHALASTCGVKYIMSPFSSTNSSLQRIATPAEVINNAGGLCVETAVTMASALQATNMHAVLILLPGHCQTAVETWQGSGEYYLIETTALTNAASATTDEDFNNVISYMNKQQWQEYLAQDGVVAIDCDLAEQLHIQSID